MLEVEADLTNGTVVAVTIDTDDFPYRSLKLRGTVSATPASGLGDHYKHAAVRYLGEQMVEQWLSFLGNPDQVVLAIRPTWAVVANMATGSPFMAKSSLR